MNLLKETIEELKEHNLTVKDIVAVQGEKFGVSVDKFLELADTNYDNGYGSPKVAEDLVVIGKDWWFERHEYDGREWWEFKKVPDILPIRSNINALTVGQTGQWGGWETLESLNIEVKEND